MGALPLAGAPGKRAVHGDGSRSFGGQAFRREKTAAFFGDFSGVLEKVKVNLQKSQKNFYS